MVFAGPLAGSVSRARAGSRNLDFAGDPGSAALPMTMRKPTTLGRAAREQLRHVKVPEGEISLARFPDFLIVGPQRTGTTWLHQNLRDHPEIFWPRLKEIFFFSRLREPEHPKFQSDSLRWYLDLFHDPPWMWAAKNYFSLRLCGRFYRPRVFGEATASYAAMDRELIDEIVAINPAVRAIIMIRNPVERAWSHAKKDLVRNAGRNFADVTAAEWQAFFSDDYQRRCAAYRRNIENWTAALAEGHVLIGKFDDIAERPEAFLLEVMDFLGVDGGERYFGPDLRSHVNPTSGGGIPDEHRRYLEDLLADDFADLRDHFGLSWS